jgi:TonB family protein
VAAAPVAQAPVAAAPAAQAPTEHGPGAEVTEGALVDAAEIDTRPQLLTEGKIVLPRSVLMTRVPVDGYVVLGALINEKGGVDEVRVQSSLSPPRPGVDDACVQAIKQNRYQPATKNGQRVKTWISVSIHIVIKAAR